jgi:hypothetical protein
MLIAINTSTDTVAKLLKTATPVQPTASKALLPRPPYPASLIDVANHGLDDARHREVAVAAFQALKDHKVIIKATCREVRYKKNSEEECKLIMGGRFVDLDFASCTGFPPSEIVHNEGGALMSLTSSTCDLALKPEKTLVDVTIIDVVRPPEPDGHIGAKPGSEFKILLLLKPCNDV